MNYTAQHPQDWYQWMKKKSQFFSKNTSLFPQYSPSAFQEEGVKHMVCVCDILFISSTEQHWEARFLLESSLFLV